MQKGNISVQTENIFPIIKQFLYSDQEIFLRELVSNAVDATSKLRTLSKRGETGEIGETTIDISIDKEAKTISILDRGIGMTEEEVNKYLNQVAFSSAEEFVEKYKDDAQVIGHFGLGFYSAFMVADKVEVNTLSYKGGQAVQWTCLGDPSFTLEDTEKDERGTEIVLHVSEDSLEYLEDSKIQELLDKYCKFLPVEIRFGTKTETTPAEKEGEEATETQVDNIVNNPNPLWKKQPSELNDEDYQSFYNELYPYSPTPLFWIHLNIDFPFNLTGILYFPKLSNNLEVQKNKIQLYSNQVFVTDDVSAIVPEFLTLLQGVIDSPDIPLNVSRSYLQADKNVKKITSYITKKVADKLAEIFKNDRKDFEEKWESVSAFVKYGMLTEDKFYDKATKFSLFESVDGSFSTLEEYKEKVKDTQTDKHDKQVFIYTQDVEGQSALIEGAKKVGYDVLKSDTVIDTHYMQMLEQKDGNITFVRVDSDTVDNLVQKDEEKESVLTEDQQTKIKTLFEENVNAPGSQIVLQAMSADSPPVQITKPEFMRRMKEMQSMQGVDLGNFPDSYNVVVNTNHPLITEKLLKAKKTKESLTQYLFGLALLQQGMLKGDKLSKFVSQSIEFLEK